MNERNEIYETAEFYLNKQSSVHITLKSGDWLNGIILKIDKEKERLVLMEERFGEMLVLFERIKEDGIVPRAEVWK